MDRCSFFKMKTKKPSLMQVCLFVLDLFSEERDVFPLLRYLINLHTAETWKLSFGKGLSVLFCHLLLWRCKRFFPLWVILHDWSHLCSPGDISLQMYRLLLSKTALSPWNFLKAIFNAAVAFKATSFMYVFVQRWDEWKSSRSVYFDINFWMYL